MSIYMLAYMALLFVVLTPGVVVSLPPRCGKLTVAVVHGLIFATVWHFTNKLVARATRSMEGFQVDDEEEEKMMM